jgi:hypothetical protein
MTRDRSLETTVLLQDIAVVLAAMLLSRVAHGALVGVVPNLKPPVAGRGVRTTCCWSSCPPGCSRRIVWASTA